MMLNYLEDCQDSIGQIIWWGHWYIEPEVQGSTQVLQCFSYHSLPTFRMMILQVSWMWQYNSNLVTWFTNPTCFKNVRKGCMSKSDPSTGLQHTITASHVIRFWTIGMAKSTSGFMNMYENATSLLIINIRNNAAWWLPVDLPLQVIPILSLSHKHWQAAESRVPPLSQEAIPQAEYVEINGCWSETPQIASNWHYMLERQAIYSISVYEMQ